jgi:hypothetical protein
MRGIPNRAAEREYGDDMETGRRVELPLSCDCLVTLQYFPDFDNISLSFYAKGLPGFTMGMPTEDWPAFQAMVAAFQWRGKTQ